MRKRLFGILGSVAIIVAACGGATTSSAPPASGGASSPAASGSAAAPSASAAAGAQTLNFAIDADVSGGLTNAADNVPTAQAIQFLYDALYIFDASLSPQPGLAASLADISTDGTVWTVKLKDGVKFSDGSPLTADDVVQTYALAQSTNCTYSPALCMNSFLASVE